MLGFHFCWVWGHRGDGQVGLFLFVGWLGGVVLVFVVVSLCRVFSFFSCPFKVTKLKIIVIPFGKKKKKEKESEPELINMNKY